MIGPVHARAALYAPAPPETKTRRGPRRKKGDRLKSVEAWEKDRTSWKKLHFDQYGLHGSLRVKTRTGLYYKAGKDRLLRFVLSQDTVGKRPTRIFYCTDVSFKPRKILSIFSLCWSIEVTHFDCKQHLGLEDPGYQENDGMVLRRADAALLLAAVLLVQVSATIYLSWCKRSNVAAFAHVVRPKLFDVVWGLLFTPKCTDLRCRRNLASIGSSFVRFPGVAESLGHQVS